MSPGAVRWGHNVACASNDDSDTGTVLLVTTPAPRVGDILRYYTEDAEVTKVTPQWNPRDMYEIEVRAIKKLPDPPAEVKP